MRELRGNLETRQQLLNVKPNQRPNWTSLAVAHHLCGNLDTAVQVCWLALHQCGCYLEVLASANTHRVHHPWRGATTHELTRMQVHPQHTPGSTRSDVRPSAAHVLKRCHNSRCEPEL